ncbi:MAG: IS1634 family transposase, partial [Candidatus Methanofastidiosia archaeon]
ADWANQAFVRERYGLSRLDQQTLYRTLERLGTHTDEIMAHIQHALFEAYDFPSTDVNLDWTSIVLHGNMAKLGKYGYSRDHRPDKRQLTLGLCELASPINVPIGMTVRAGNINDQDHFKDTYSQVRHLLKDESLVIFDKGASSQGNKELVRYDHMHYLSSKKLNKSDDIRIKNYEKRRPVVVDEDKGIVGVRYEKPHSIDYFYFSRTLYENQMASVKRRARRMVDEAIELQRDLDAGKKIKKKFRGGIKGNVLIDATTSFQTKLVEMSEKEAYEYAFSRCRNGREGFFCLKSSKDLTLTEALVTYRKKDSIEKIFHSLKNEIEIKPVRCWKKERQYGVLLIGFIAQLFVSLLRYDVKEVAHTSTKFIKKSLRNLTETNVFGRNGVKRHIFSNFDDMNMMILRKCGAIS